MMYIRDEIADEIVAKHETLQDVVRGKVFMPWRPGQLATVAAQVCIAFGGIGTSTAAFWLWPLSVESMKYYLLFGVAPLGIVIVVLFGAIVRGRRSARSHVYRFTIAMVAMSVIVVVASVVLSKLLSLVAAVAGLAFNGVSNRLVAGEGYALTSALFRAQRSYLESVKGSANT